MVLTARGVGLPRCQDQPGLVEVNLRSLGMARCWSTILYCSLLLMYLVWGLIWKMDCVALPQGLKRRPGGASRGSKFVMLVKI